ncbi:hypothetical protein [Nitrospira sp. Nam80]
MVEAGEVIARYSLPEQSPLETGLGHKRHTEEKIDPSSLGNGFSILSRDVQLGNDGGIITLLDGQGLKIHGVSYTKEQVQREGWTIVFGRRPLCATQVHNPHYS